MRRLAIVLSMVAALWMAASAVITTYAAAQGGALPPTPPAARATISGVVTNDRGMPLAGLHVRLWRVYDDRRALQIFTDPGAITDATGRYRPASRTPSSVRWR